MRTRVVVFGVAVAVVLGPALLLTGARVFEPFGAVWLRLVSFTPLGIVLYGVALVGALIALVVVRRRRWLPAAVATLCGAGLALHCWWFAPQLTGANPPPADGAERLTVMTANVLLGSADGVDVVRVADDRGVDLLVVQEITPAHVADMERAGLLDLFPYRAGDPGAVGEGTMVFSRAPIGEPERVSTTHDGWLVRTLGVGVLAVHSYPPTVPEVWRSDHAVIAAAVEDLEPDLVVGDLNATADHAPMRALADAGYRDASELANEGWEPTWPAGGSVDVLGLPLPALSQIDHVLVGPSLAALSMQTAEIQGSDHRAVVAVVAPR